MGLDRRTMIRSYVDLTYMHLEWDGILVANTFLLHERFIARRLGAGEVRKVRAYWIVLQDDAVEERR